MRCLSKKILCYIICGLLTFSVTSTVYYKSVHAMEWVGGALAFEEALKWLLASIGITATAGMTDAYWDTYGDDFTDYAIENGATQTEVAEWQLKVCQGIIDKGSEVWTKFKAWASSLLGGQSSDIPPVGTGYSQVLSWFNSYYHTNLVYNSSFDSYNVYGICAYPSLMNVWFIVDVNNLNVRSNGFIQGAKTIYYYNNSGSYDSYTNIPLNENGRMISRNITNGSSYVLDYIPFGESSSVSDDNFQGVVTNVNDLDVISSDGVDEDNPEVTIPMPGVSDSDNEASKDAYQDIIDAINDGTITQEQGVEQIHEILKIVTYDTVTDKVVPPQQNEDGTDKTKDDVLKENKENMGFTLGGLEDVFPFCIPFDIYAFMTLLVAEPECPEFDFPIKSVNGQVEEIHVDLEPFEPVAVVVRYVFDFLFIIGLAMLTRSLIGGGSSD